MGKLTDGKYMNFTRDDLISEIERIRAFLNISYDDLERFGTENMALKKELEDMSK